MKKIVTFCLALLAFGIYYTIKHKVSPQQESPAVVVKTIKVKPQEIPLVYQTIGIVNPKQKAELRPQIDGILTEILFNEGASVQKGQVLAKIDNRIFEAELDKAEADLAADEAKLKEISSNLQRFEKLSKNSIISQKTLEEQQSLYKQQVAQVKKDKEQVMMQKVNLEYTEIKAPFDGKVGLRQIDVGNFVRASEEKVLTSVVQTNPIVVNFSVPQDLLPYLKQKEKIQIQALSRTNDEVLATGHIAAVNNQIDSQSGTLEIKAEFANDSEVLWSGEFVKVKMIYDILKNSVVLPNEAVRPSLDGSMVYKVEDGKVKIEKVTVGYQSEKETVISFGVNENDEVVCDGFPQLTNGTAVQTEQTNE